MMTGTRAPVSLSGGRNTLARNRTPSRSTMGTFQTKHVCLLLARATATVYLRLSRCDNVVDIRFGGRPASS